MIETKQAIHGQARRNLLSPGFIHALIHSTNIYGCFQCVRFVSAGDIVIHMTGDVLLCELTFSLSAGRVRFIFCHPGSRPGAHLHQHNPVSALRTETNSTSAPDMYTIGAQRTSGVALSYVHCKILQEPSLQLNSLGFLLSASSDLITSSRFK